MYVTNIVVDSVLSVSSFQDLIATLYCISQDGIFKLAPRFLVSAFPNGRGEKKALYSRKLLKISDSGVMVSVHVFPTLSSASKSSSLGQFRIPLTCAAR